MNHGRIQLAEGELREPKKKKVRPGTLLRDPYPIIFWNKLGIPPCKELWPSYAGVFDGDSVIVEDPRDMHEISTMGYFGKRLMCRRGYEQSIGDVPVVRERQWKRRVEWAAECGYILVPPDKASLSGSPDHSTELDPIAERTIEVSGSTNVELSECSEAGEKSGVLGDGEVAVLGVDIPCGADQGKVDKDEEQVAVLSKNQSPTDQEDHVIEHQGDLSPSGARKSITECRDVQKESIEVCEKESEGVEGDQEQGAVSKGEDGSDLKMKVPAGKEKETESRQPHGEEKGDGTIKPSETKGEAAVEVSAKGPVCAEDKAATGLGEGGDSSIATSSREEDPKLDEEMRDETEESNSAIEVDPKEVDESLARKGDAVSKQKAAGSARGYQGARRSPRSTRSSASKSKDSELGGCDSLSSEGSVSPAQGMSRGRARRNLRKSLAPDGAGDGLDAKGDSSIAANTDDVKPEEGGPADITVGTEGKDKQFEGAEKKETLVDSAAVSEKADGDVEVSSKGGEDSSTAQEKCSKSVDSGEVEAKEEPKSDKDDATEDESHRTPRRSSRRGRGSKRNRSPSVDGAPLVDNASGEGIEKSEEGMREEVPTVKRSRVTPEVPEKEGESPKPQKEEVAPEKTAEAVHSETCEDSMETNSEQAPELGKDDIEKEECDSMDMKEADQQCSVEGLVEEKKEGTNLNKSSSDCEIVDIEDESNTQHSILLGDDSLIASTPCKPSEDPKLDAPCVTNADSDDDIMEVSVEEEEVREVGRDGQMIVNRRRSSSNLAGEGTAGINNVKDLAEAERLKFQRMLREIRMNLPKDIEVTEVNLKKEAEAAAAKNPVVATIVDNDDDDVIEINLQKSDMMELEEGCDEEEVDVEVESGRDDQTSCLQRRMRKESCGFHRKDRDGLGGDPLRAKQEAELESITTGNQGSICEVAPCIVIPDSDSDAEEAEGSPRLESDPSIFLPSLDVLQLIPEEAFFLAYGLGCLVVWDVRNIDLVPTKNEDEPGCSDDLVPHPSVKVENSCTGDGIDGNAPSSDSLNDRLHVENTPSRSECVDGSSDSVNGDDLGHQPGSSNGGLVTSTSVKAEKGECVAVSPSKSDSRNEKKSSLSKTETSVSPKVSSLEEVVSNETSNGNPNAGDEAANVGKKSDDSVEKRSVEKDCVLDITDKSDQVDVDSPCQKSGVNLESRENTRDTSEEKMRNISCDSKSGIRDLSDPPKENGDVGDSSITIIDLADSPPSRGWARKSWPSQDDEDVFTMDTDVNDVPSVDPEPSIPENPSERTLQSECQRPMSILELWNAFRSCRASVSSSIPFETTYAVYHHFRSKRWVVKPGIRFGGDFLLYKDGPPFYHASYLVVIDSFGPDGESKFDWKTLSGMNRLAENIAKDLMLCRVEWPPTVTKKDLQSPECLMGLVVQEVLVRRWVSLKERDAEDPIEEDDDDQESFIPLKVNP